MHRFQGMRQGRIFADLATSALVLQWPDHIYPVLRRLGEACCSPNPLDRPSFNKMVDALQRTIVYIARWPSPSSEPGYGHLEGLWCLVGWLVRTKFGLDFRYSFRVGVEIVHRGAGVGGGGLC